ncbi:hypothetical protein [Adhaeribacter rhizoryzae]|uniref:Uncharacterized protein n=1 Tax=Adhaeribacter rhizoryzae TaxID=2607907 RepID=A0A5M6CV82_9BACT|nr:hypothetical protein [Adhaeribacter rhizoryzae]KAA5539157.1 hypothetical protein F0145_25140 [Adhaeribacter rhizoryzae]
MDTFDNSLEIPVTYKGQELSFPAQVLMTGYTHKIQVEVDGHWIMFEPDEERNYRPVLDAAQIEKGVKQDVNLLKEIASVINSVVK